TAARTLVADDDDIAGLDRAGLHGGKRGLFAVEHARRTAVRVAVVTGELDDAAIGRQRPAQDREAAARLECGLDGAQHGRRVTRALDRRGLFAQRLAGTGRRIDE